MPVGPGYGPPRKSHDGETNGMAIASFVTGLLGCFGILGAVLGAIALSQIGRRGGRGRGFAIAGIGLSCMWLAGSLVLYAAGVIFADSATSQEAGGSPVTSQTQPREVDARKMKVGNCINDDQGASNTTATGEPVVVESVKIVPCDGPHDGEVVVIFRLHNSVMPSDREMAALASAGCEERMRSKISRDPAADALATSYYYPTTESWRQGDRAVTCVAVAAKQGTKLTRRLRT